MFAKYLTADDWKKNSIQKSTGPLSHDRVLLILSFCVVLESSLTSFSRRWRAWTLVVSMTCKVRSRSPGSRGLWGQRTRLARERCHQSGHNDAKKRDTLTSASVKSGWPGSEEAVKKGVWVLARKAISWQRSDFLLASLVHAVGWVLSESHAHLINERN